MADVHGKAQPPRNGVGRTRQGFDEAEGEARIAAVARRSGIERRQQVRQHPDRIAPHVHRRGARMRLLAFDDHFVPAHVLHAGDDSDGLVFLLENRPLFDVDFE